MGASTSVEQQSGAAPADETTALSPTANGNGNGNGIGVSHIVAADSDPSAAVMPWVMQCIASIVLIIAICFTKVDVVNGGYALAVGIIGTLFAGLALFLIRTMPDTWLRKVMDAPMQAMHDVTLGTLFALFAFVWWSIGAGVITFQAPYTVASNGYFAAWTGFITSLMSLGWDVGGTGTYLDKLGPVTELLIASLVLLFALIPTFYNPTPGQIIYGTIVAVLTIMWTLFSLIVEHATAEENGLKPIVRSVLVYLFWTVLWAVAAIVLTFQAPFEIVGNGFFASVSLRPATPLELKGSSALQAFAG